MYFIINLLLDWKNKLNTLHVASTVVNLDTRNKVSTCLMLLVFSKVIPIGTVHCYFLLYFSSAPERSWKQK